MVTEDQDAVAPAPRKSARRSGKRFALDVLVILVAAILISFLLKTFLVRSFYIPSGSMMNTLQINDRIIVNELEPKLVPITRGDVVVFTDPGGWLDDLPADTRNDFQKVTDGILGFVGLSAPDSNNHLIKRVIGLPGDHVECCDSAGRITVNGVPLEEPYIVTGDATDSAPDTFDVVVPAGRLWVMGDNRYESGDSLAHVDDPDGGFVPVDDVVGRAVLTTWPLSRWSVLDNYSGTFGGVPSP